MATKVLTRWRGGGAACVLLGVLLLVLLNTENPLPADDEAKAEVLPPDLAKVPSDAIFLVSGRVADLWALFVKPVPEQPAVKAASRQLEKLWGMPPEQVERWTLVMLSPPPSREEPLYFLRTRKAYDRAKVLATGKNVKQQKYKGQTLYTGDKQWGVYPIDDRSLVYGNPAGLRQLIDRPTPKVEGNLADTLRLAAGKHSLVCGVNVKAINDAVGNQFPGEAEPFRPLLQASSGTLTVDVAVEARAVARLNFATEKDARAAVKPVQTAFDMARAGLEHSAAELGKQSDTAQILELLKHAQASLQSAKIEQQGKMLQASANLQFDAVSTRIALQKAVQKVRESAARTQSAANFHNIGIAMHNYHDTYGHLPPQASYDKNGKPMLSWRVLILPFIEQQALYNRFHVNEPWDSEHNKKLLAMMPKTYASPNDLKTVEEHTTHYQGFVGKGAFFDGKQGLRLPADFPDGTSNTFMIVEASKAVPWTKPEDIPYDAKKPLPKLGLPGADGFLASLCDGSVRTCSHKIAAKTLRLVIERNDGMPIPADF